MRGAHVPSRAAVGASPAHSIHIKQTEIATPLNTVPQVLGQH